MDEVVVTGLLQFIEADAAGLSAAIRGLPFDLPVHRRLRRRYGSSHRSVSRGCGRLRVMLAAEPAVLTPVSW